MLMRRIDNYRRPATIRFATAALRLSIASIAGMACIA
jgi:hypothetical protein